MVTTKELKNNVVDVYKNVYTILDEEAQKHGVDSNLYVKEDEIIYGINNLSSINALKNKKLEADNFKAEQLGKIIDAIPKPEGAKKTENETYHLAKDVSTIASEEELNNYIDKIKAEMLQLIKDHKTIILR